MFTRTYEDLWIKFSLIAMSFFGLLMIGSASIGSEGQLANPNFPAIRIGIQIAVIVISYICMQLARKLFSLPFFRKRKTLIILGVGFGLFMLVPLAFGSVNGSKAWIQLPGFSIQPSEFTKLFIIIFLAYILTEMPKAIHITKNMSYYQATELQKRKFILCVVEPACFVAVYCFICLKLQSDLGSTMVLFAVSLVCFFTANNPYYRNYQKYVLWAIIAFVVIFAIFHNQIISLLPSYQQARFRSWLNPLDDPYNTSYQLLNGMIAFVKNGLNGVGPDGKMNVMNVLTGAGFGNSTQKFGYIPEAYNDFISAIIFEELGLFGLFCMLVPNCIIIFKLISYSLKVSDGRAKIILYGVASYFFSHLILNLGGVTGLIPMTGIPLLCISAGGSSTLSAYIGIGIAQNVISSYNRKKHAASQ